MNLVDRHVALALFRSFGQALAALVAVFAVADLTEELRTAGLGGWSVGQALWFVVLTLPSQAYTLFPAATLLGAVLGLGRLADDHELVALQAAGVAPLRIARAALFATFVIAGFGIAFGELVAAPLSQRAHAQRALALSGGHALSTASGLWIRDGARFVNVGALQADGSLRDVYQYEFAGGHVLKSFSYAPSAEPVAGAWQLQDLRESTFHDDVASTVRVAAAPWTLGLDPQRVQALWLEPRDLSLAELVRTISDLRAQGQKPLAHEVAFWRRVGAPMYMGLMVLLAVPMVMASGRTVRLGERTLVGALVGVGFQMGAETFTNVGLVAGLPPLVIALVPAFVAGTAVVVLFGRMGLR